MSTELVTVERNLRAPVGLVVSTGSPKPARGPGRPIGWFRFKDGTEDEPEKYAAAAQRARDAYGEQPTELDDVYLLSNAIGQVLDIRILAWAKSGLRIVGRTNYATLPRDEYVQRVDAWDDDALYRPRELKDVPKRMQAEWQGEPIPFKFEGPDDPRVADFDCRVTASFRFALPRVLGMGEVVLYSTGSKHNRDQLFYGVTDAFTWFQGNPIGVPFRFKLRQRRTSYFDPSPAKPAERGYRPTTTYEVVFDSPWTWAEAIEAVREQRQALGPGGQQRELPAGPADQVDPASFFDSDERQADEAADVPFVPIEPFDPEQQEPVEGEVVDDEPGEAFDFEARAQEAQQRKDGRLL